jgi:hypothetical protein
MDCRNIDDVDKTMDEINEQTENMKQIQEALSTPIGTAADIDEVNSDLQLVFYLLLLLHLNILAESLAEWERVNRIQVKFFVLSSGSCLTG